MYVDLGKHVDVTKEVARINKEMATVQRKLDQVSRKLQNPKFLSGAPATVVEAEKAKDQELREMLEKLESLKQEYANN